MQQMINALSAGGALSLFALGFTLLFGVLGVLNFAHGQLMMAGAMGGVYATRVLDMPVWSTFLVGMVSGAVTSLLLELIVFRFLRRRQAEPFVQLVASIGAAVVITGIVAKITNSQTYRYPPDELTTGTVELFGATIPNVHIVMILLAIVLVFALEIGLTRSSLGRRIRAMADDSDIAGALGVSTSRIWMGVFLAAGALAGVTGVFQGMTSHAMDAYMGHSFLLLGFAAVVIGGLGNIKGAVVGAFLVSFIRVFGIAWISSAFADAITFAIVFLFIALRPNGFFGAELERA